jgi:hypothetical protein
MISRLHFTPFNMVCTSVPGPQVPLYILGHKMLHWYPYVPVGGEMAVNCAILSYNGMVYFGFSGDAHVAPDLGRLEKFLKLSFADLREAVGIKPSREKPREKRKRTQPKTPLVSKTVRTTTVRVPISLPAARPLAEPVRGPDPRVEAEKTLSQMIA